MFWITGKPGSGKSTLMKHLVDSNMTLNLLREIGFPWKTKPKYDWKIIHFFYDFTGGAAIANTPEGMLRSWILQLAHHSPKSVTSAPESLTIAAMIEVIVEALQSDDKRFCIFVDGLDEYEGDLTTLMSLLLEIEQRTRVKLCLASRPEAPIQLALRDHISGKLVMQKWNHRTIRHYLEKVNSTIAAKLRRPCPTQVLDQITDRADGVILWARLAFENILHGCQLGEEIDALVLRLEELPAEVEGLYERALSKISTDTKIESALYLRSVRTLGPLSANELLSVVYHANGCRFLKSDYSLLCALTTDQFRYRISALCGALIVTDDEARLSFWSQVRALQDFCIDKILPPKGPSRSLRSLSTTRFRLVHETLRTYLRLCAFPAEREERDEVQRIVSAYADARQLSARWEEHADRIGQVSLFSFYGCIGMWCLLLFIGPQFFD